MDIDAPDTAPEIKKVNGVPDCNEVVLHARAMHKNAIHKGTMLTDTHVASTKLQEAVNYAQAAKAQLAKDAADPEFPAGYKAKLDAEVKQADQVIDHVQKHESKNKEVADKVGAIESGLEVPHKLQVQVEEISLVAGKDDKEGYDSKDHSGSLHYEAYMSVAKAALKVADAAAGEQAKTDEAEKKAAEEAAAKEAERKAAEEAAAKKAAEAAAAKKAAEEKEADEAAAKKAAEEAAAAAEAAKEAAAEEAAAAKAAEEAAAAAKAAKEAAAKAQQEADEKAKKALEEWCDPAAKVVKPTKAGIVPINVTVMNQCMGPPDGAWMAIGNYFYVAGADLGRYAGLYGGAGVLTHNLYKNGILCRSGTLSVGLRGSGVNCRTGPFKCAETHPLSIKRYCAPVPWGRDCGKCDGDDPVIMHLASTPAVGYHSQGDVIEIFKTDEGPCQPGPRNDACP